ncbi:hypothetical protein EI94DRAFT_1578923, partial [Lactarius quietus]
QSSSPLPSNRNRSAVVHALVTAFGLLSTQSHSPPSHHLTVLRPCPASTPKLTLYYDRSYVDEFGLDSEDVIAAPMLSLPLVFTFETQDCPPFPGLREYVLGIAGASLTAARELAKDRCDIPICWDGGRHHAHKSKASGFCYINDCVLALPVLRRAPPQVRKRFRIMYLELDVHYGERRRRGVLRCRRSRSGPDTTVSIHHAARGFFLPSEHSALPDPPSNLFGPFTLSFRCTLGASSATFMRVWKAIARIHIAFAPDYIVLQCGVAGLAGDPIGAWNWSLGGEGGFVWFVRCVLHSSAKVLLLGGSTLFGLSMESDPLLPPCGAPLALDTPIPTHAGFPMYAPSFILDVPAGNVRDENSDDYLTEIDVIFERVAEILRTQLA